MLLKNICAFIIISFLLLACSSSYDLLSTNSFNTQDSFSHYLLNEYKKQADFEAKKMHDWNSTKLYSEKAIKAADGIRIQPEKISYWKIPDKHVAELQKAYDNLMKVYSNALKTNAYDLAVAISSLDCWAEQQEENWQTWDIKNCRKNYLNAMHNIYNNISDNKKNIDDKLFNNESKQSVTIVTKNKKDEIKQIIYFDFDQTILNNISKQEIKNYYNNNHNYITQYLIVGHADTKGTHEYNLKLSKERAIVVKNLLFNLGVNKNDIKILALGENDLAVETKDEIAHPANRRAVISSIN